MGVWILVLCAVGATTASRPDNQDPQVEAVRTESSKVESATPETETVTTPSGAAGSSQAEETESQETPQAVPLHEHPTLVQMLAENNRLRAGLGLPPHTISPKLTKAAQDHAWYMARTGNFSHHSNGGPLRRALRYGFQALASENIAQGHTSVRDVFRGWRASPGHWSNIISRTTTKAGFGYGISPNGERYWVVMYGN